MNPTSATAHIQEVFGQAVFAPVGKSLFEVRRPTTVIIGRLRIRFGGLQLRGKKVHEM